MDYDFQRASMLKRAPAWLLDIILLVTLASGLLFAWSHVFSVAPHVEELTAKIDTYEKEFGGSLNPVGQNYDKMTEEEKAAANEISMKIDAALNQDERAMWLLETIATNIFAMLSLSVACAYLILEFLIPLWLKNGQTIGKKCFGVALMRKDGITVTPFMVFVRTILGKCTIETMIPILLVVMMLLMPNGMTLLLLAAMMLAQIIIPVATRNKTAIHDLMACTVAVDLSSQMIFDSVEAMEEYHAKIHVEKAFEEQE